MSVWTAQRLLQTDAVPDEATDEEVESMLSELHSEWVARCPRSADGNVQIDSLCTWACEKFEVCLESVTAAELNERVMFALDSSENSLMR